MSEIFDCVQSLMAIFQRASMLESYLYPDVAIGLDELMGIKRRAY
ncbi:MAG TPA: hypothetical protein PLV25_01890 [Opitutales bacterium]|nr:hypothetical protein [Opitutales bacterium]